MGVIKGISVVVLSVILFLSLFSTILFLNLSEAIEFNSLQSNALPILKDTLKNKTEIGSTVSQNLDFIKLYCANNSDYHIQFENYSLDIPCNSNITEDYILEEAIKDMFSQVYFKEYSCNLIECFSENETPIFLISQMMYKKLTNYLYLSLIFSACLVVILFFLFNKKSNLFILTGVLLLVLSLLSLQLSSLSSLFSEEIISQAVDIFFASSRILSIKLIVLSVFLIALGIIFKIFNFGFLISKIFNKENLTEQVSPKSEKVAVSKPDKKQDLNKK